MACLFCLTDSNLFLLSGKKEIQIKMRGKKKKSTAKPL